MNFEPDDIEEDEEDVYNPLFANASRGLKHLEKFAHAYHVVNGERGCALELAELMPDALPVNLDIWDYEGFMHHLKISTNYGEKPVRVIFRNLDRTPDSDYYYLELIVKNKLEFPISSVWFVQEGEQHLDPLFIDKILMRTQLVDAYTLLDACALGWEDEEDEESDD